MISSGCDNAWRWWWWWRRRWRQAGCYGCIECVWLVNKMRATWAGETGPFFLVFPALANIGLADAVVAVSLSLSRCLVLFFYLILSLASPLSLGRPPPANGPTPQEFSPARAGKHRPGAREFVPSTCFCQKVSAPRPRRQSLSHIAAARTATNCFPWVACAQSAKTRLPRFVVVIQSGPFRLTRSQKGSHSPRYHTYCQCERQLDSFIHPYIQLDHSEATHSLTMLLHPSVIMSISEHHSRTKALRGQADVVVGALLGKKRDHQIEIVDSIELRIVKDSTPGENGCNLTVDRDFVQKRIPLVKQVFPDLDLIGWYSTSPQSDGPEEGNFVISLHKQISEFIVNPIYVKLDPNSRESDPKISGSLPLKIYEPVIEITGSKEHLNLIESGWTVVTEDVEIIGLEHNAKVTHIDRAPSAAVDYLKLQYGAVKMLKDRIKVISKFAKDVQSGALPYYEEPMADIIRLTKRFPMMNSDAYTRAYNMQCNDVALNTYLGILTKGSMCKMNFDKPSSKMRALSTTRARHWAPENKALWKASGRVFTIDFSHSLVWDFPSSVRSFAFPRKLHGQNLCAWAFQKPTWHNPRYSLSFMKARFSSL